MLIPLIPTFLVSNVSDDQNKSFSIEEGKSFNMEGEVRMRSMMRTDMTMSSKKSCPWGKTCNLVRSDLLRSGRRAKMPAGINFATKFVVNFSVPKKHCRNNKMNLFSKLSLDLPIKWMLRRKMVIPLPSIAPVDFLQNDDSTNMTVETDTNQQVV